MFTMYNGQIDPVEHVSHFNQRMAMHSKNETLICKMFPSNLEPVVMRWFDGLGASSINFFKELTPVFGSRFIMCSRVPQPLDSLLSMSIWEGETLKTYSDRYREMFNKIDGDFDDVAIRTIKVGLLVEHDLRKSLTNVGTTTWLLSGWVFKQRKVWSWEYFFIRKITSLKKKNLRSRHLFYYFFRENKTRNKNPFFFIWLTQWIRKMIYVH